MRRMLTAALLLLLSTLPVAATSTFVIGNSRITFITPHLVRLEYALHGAFLDDSTLFAVTRRPDYGVSVSHEQQACATIRLTYRRDDDRVSLGVAPTQGTFAGQLPRRAYRFELPGVEAKSTVRLNGRRVRSVSYSKELDGLIINLPAQPIGRALTLTVSAR